MTAAAVSCARCRTVVERGDLRCPVCFQAVPAAAMEITGAARARILRCAGCGAAMEYRVAVQAPQCAYCDGVLKLEERVDPVEQIERNLPFVVDRNQAIAAYRRWISLQGFFRPSNLASAARLESLRALWWVGWLVDAEALVAWTADSNEGTIKAKWAPHAGQFQTEFAEVVIPATRGLSAAECARLVPTYSLTGGVPVEANDDALREQFEVARSVGRARIVAAIRELAKGRIEAKIPGSRFRNVHSAVQLRGLITRRLAFPAYVLAYRYRGRVYRTVISGQDPACVIGEAPRSLAKLLLLLLLAITLGVLSTWLLLAHLL